MTTSNNQKVYRILIVDDEEDLRDLLTDEIEYNGHQAVSASCGSEAMSIFDAETPDAIISDVRMPNGDGIELLEHVRSKNPNVPFILVTGFADISKNDAIAKGATELVPKPYRVKAS